MIATLMEHAPKYDSAPNLRQATSSHDHNGAVNRLAVAQDQVRPGCSWERVDGRERVILFACCVRIACCVLRAACCALRVALTRTRPVTM